MKLLESLLERWQKVRKYFELNHNAIELMRLTKTVDDSNNNLLQILKRFENFKPAQRNSEIKFLLDIIKVNKCKTICEIGTSLGGSLFLFCQNAPKDARLISIDIYYPLSRKHAFQKFTKKDQKLFCICGNTHNLIIEEKVKRIIGGELLDFLFIDGDHSFFGVMNDYVRFSPLVKKGGIIAFHDIQPDSYMQNGVKTTAYVGGVPDFWLMLKKNNLRIVEMIENPNQDGCGIGVVFIE